MDVRAGSALKYQLFQSLAVGAFLKTNQWNATGKADRGGGSWAALTSTEPSEALWNSGGKSLTLNLVQGQPGGFQAMAVAHRGVCFLFLFVWCVVVFFGSPSALLG